jgi:hypothetical protein
MNIKHRLKSKRLKDDPLKLFIKLSNHKTIFNNRDKGQESNLSLSDLK